MEQSDTQPYLMSFSVGGLFAYETQEIGRRVLSGLDIAMAVQNSVETGLISGPKLASKKRFGREIEKRLAVLSQTELEFMARTGAPDDQRLMLWIACCRVYRLIREFAEEALVPSYNFGQNQIAPHQFDVLLDTKAEWHDDLGSLSNGTRAKLRQILFKIMRDVGFVSMANDIQPLYVSAELREILRHTGRGELSLIPGA